MTYAWTFIAVVLKFFASDNKRPLLNMLPVERLAFKAGNSYSILTYELEEATDEAHQSLQHMYY